MRLDYASLVRPRDLGVQLELSDFGFEVQDSSNLKIPPRFRGSLTNHLELLLDNPAANAVARVAGVVCERDGSRAVRCVLIRFRAARNVVVIVRQSVNDHNGA